MAECESGMLKRQRWPDLTLPSTADQRLAAMPRQIPATVASAYVLSETHDSNGLRSWNMRS